MESQTDTAWHVYIPPCKLPSSASLRDVSLPRSPLGQACRTAGPVLGSRCFGKPWLSVDADGRWMQGERQAFNQGDSTGLSGGAALPFPDINVALCHQAFFNVACQ